MAGLDSLPIDFLLALDADCIMEQQGGKCSRRGVSDGRRSVK